MSELSDTDNRVINFLRQGRRLSASIADHCFPGGANIRPALAHLARMKDRELVRQIGGCWELTESAASPSPELSLGLDDSPVPPPKKRRS